MLEITSLNFMSSFVALLCTVFAVHTVVGLSDLFDYYQDITGRKHHKPDYYGKTNGWRQAR